MVLGRLQFFAPDSGGNLYGMIGGLESSNVILHLTMGDSGDISLRIIPEIEPVGI